MCGYCKEAFIPSKAHGGTPQVYCSAWCKGQIYGERKRQQRLVEPPVVRMRTCRQCGESFRAIHHNEQMCSDACRGARVRKKACENERLRRIKKSKLTEPQRRAAFMQERLKLELERATYAGGTAPVERQRQ